MVLKVIGAGVVNAFSASPNPEAIIYLNSFTKSSI